MLDSVFLRPIAHRGLHDAGKGVIENTPAAFEAAIAAGHGIECDLRPAARGFPVVFHDESVERLVEGRGAVADLRRRDLARLRYRGRPDQHILAFPELLDLVAGRVPLLVEIKSEWAPPQRAFLTAICAAATAYRGPIALMSFDPAVMAAVRELAPGIPRGIVSGIYKGSGWWSGILPAQRREALSQLLESKPAAPDFYAYDVTALPTSVTRFVREVMGVPMFTWTVRTPAQWRTARAWADAPIFEGAVPRP